MKKQQQLSLSHTIPTNNRTKTWLLLNKVLSNKLIKQTRTLFFYLKNTIPITKRMKTLWFFVFTHDLVKHIIKTQTIVLSLHGSDTKASENLLCLKRSCQTKYVETCANLLLCFSQTCLSNKVFKEKTYRFCLRDCVIKKRMKTYCCVLKPSLSNKVLKATYRSLFTRFRQPSVWNLLCLSITSMSINIFLNNPLVYTIPTKKSLWTPVIYV